MVPARFPCCLRHRLTQSAVPLRVSVALAKPLVDAQPDDVAIAIDVLRATTTLPVLFDRGCPRVWLAAGVDAARSIGRATGRLICGEQGGLPPHGFDHGNSPVEFARVDLTGREIVFATTNGTATLRACSPARRVYAASFVNLTAAVHTALRSLEAAVAGPAEPTAGRLLIACAGTRDRFSLEDAACAGLMVRTVLATCPGAELDDPAQAALRLYASFASPADAIRAARNARGLTSLGLAADVDFCAQLDVTQTVPQLHPDSPWPLHLVHQP